MAFPLAHFQLSGNFDPDEITKQLQIEPSQLISSGSENTAASNPKDVAHWILSGSEEDSGDVADQLITLICKLRPRADLVAELSNRYSGSIDIYASLDESYRGFFLMPSILKDLARLQVSVECTYVRDTETSAVVMLDAN